MAVSPEQIAVITRSLPRVRERLAPASAVFYDKLFAIAPELRGLFRGDMDTQGMRFMSTLATIADMLEDPEALGSELDDLATAHARVGVRPEYFAPMGEALIATLGETLGPDFTAGERAAWRAAYDHFAAEMIARGAAGKG
jgi:hemoglobin-like flavoprotein